MVRAGGLLTWAGCYLTQFFYYPMLGAGLLGLLWAFLLWLLQRTFRRKEPWPGLLPVACLLMASLAETHRLQHQQDVTDLPYR